MDSSNSSGGSGSGSGEKKNTWKGRLGKALQKAKGSPSNTEPQPASSFLNVDPYPTITVRPSTSDSFLDLGKADPQQPQSRALSSSTSFTPSISKPFYKLSSLAKSANDLRTLFSGPGPSASAPPSTADFTPAPQAQSLSPSSSGTSATMSVSMSTHSRDSASASVWHDASQQASLVRTIRPAEDDRPEKELVYHVAEWENGKALVKTKHLPRPDEAIREAARAMDQAMDTVTLWSDREDRKGKGKEVDVRLPDDWTDRNMDDGVWRHCMSYLDFAASDPTMGLADLARREGIAESDVDTPSIYDVFDPQSIPGPMSGTEPLQPSKPLDPVDIVKAHHRSPSADPADFLPRRRREHSASTITQKHFPSTSPTTPRFATSARFGLDVETTPKAPEKREEGIVEEVEQGPGSPAPSSVCLPDNLAKSLPGPMAASTTSIDIDTFEPALSRQSSEASGVFDTAPESPTLGALDIPLPASRRPSLADFRFPLQPNAPAGATDALPKSSKRAKGKERAEGGRRFREDRKGLRPEEIPLPPSPIQHRFAISQHPGRELPRRVSIDSDDVIRLRHPTRPPNFPPVNCPNPNQVDMRHASISSRHWFVPRPQMQIVQDIYYGLTYFWATFNEKWRLYVPKPLKELKMSDMSHAEQKIYLQQDADELHEAQKVGMQRYARNARYLVELKSEGKAIIPDPNARRTQEPLPRPLGPYPYGRELETRLNRRAKAIRQVVWGVDDRPFAKIVHEQEKFVGLSYKRLIKPWRFARRREDKQDKDEGMSLKQMGQAMRPIRPQRGGRGSPMSEERRAGEGLPSGSGGSRFGAGRSLPQPTRAGLAVASSLTVNTARRMPMDEDDDGAPTPRASSRPPALPPKDIVTRKTRHSRTRHSLADLSLEIRQQAQLLIDEMDALADAAFPELPPREGRTVPEDAWLRVLPPTPVQVSDALMTACEDAEKMLAEALAEAGLSSPGSGSGDEAGSGSDESKTPSAERTPRAPVNQREEQGRYLTVPSAMAGYGRNRGGQTTEEAEDTEETEEAEERQEVAQIPTTQQGQQILPRLGEFDFGDEGLWPGMEKMLSDSREMERLRLAGGGGEGTGAERGIEAGEAGRAREEAGESREIGGRNDARSVLDEMPAIGNVLVGDATAWWHASAPREEGEGQGPE